MENQFWDVLSGHPFFVLVVIVGGIFALAALLNAISKIHDILGFKTRAEIEREEFIEHDKKRDEQIAEMWKEIKDMRRENRADFKTLSTELQSVKNANVMFLGDRITQKTAYYTNAGGIPADEIKEFQAMYETYKAIGGNHGVDVIFEKTIASLPLIGQSEVKEAI